MQLSVNPAKNTKQPSLVKPQSDDIISTPRTTLSQMDFFSTSSFWLPDYPAPSAWLEHAPFAFWITEIHRPKVLVELGSHHGFSYFCFCQAMQRLSIDGHCYAVDTWLGDEHAGFYDESVYSAVNRKNAASYRSLSTLMRMTFDEALAYFPDHSVDLLHIDGRHGYDDVRHDFEQWEPKLSDRGIVLFHDINVREREFGVWKYWHELQQRYPTFAFRHGHGLGVLAVGSNLTPLVARLFDVANSAPLAGAIREGYANLGATVHRLFETADAEQSQRRRAIDLASALEKKEQELTKLHGEAERLTLQAKQFALQLEQITREKEQTIAQLRREAEHSVSQKQQEIAQLQHRFELMAEQKDRELARMREQHDLKTTATTLELERLHREIACLKKTAENVRIKKVITKRLKDYYYPRYPGLFKWSTSYKRWNAKRLANLPRANAGIPTSYNRYATRPRLNDKRHISVKKRITRRLKDIFYPRYPWLFCRTASYKRWYRQAYHANANENHAEWRKSPDCHSESNNGEGSCATHGPANPSATALNDSAKPVQKTSTQPTKPDLPRSGSGDSDCYLAEYPDVAASGLNPLVHYLGWGYAEGRKPLPAGRRETAAPVPEEGPLRSACFAGARAADPVLPSLLLCAHAANDHLFGGERSFLDLVEVLSGTPYNVYVLLPAAPPAYIEALCRHAVEVIHVPYGYWRAGMEPDRRAVAAIRAAMLERHIALVHVNTMVVREPLLAARRLGIPTFMHVRESVRADRWISEQIGGSPEAILQQALASTDCVIANSPRTAAEFRKDGHTFIVPNSFDLHRLDLDNPVDPKEIRAGLISSNIPKKGIEDFAQLATACADVIPNLRFVLIGPDNGHVAGLRARQQRGEITARLRFVGYQERPEDALAQVNIVLSLSHFAESFGRTVAEGLAARRPAIVYNLGAAQDLVEHGHSGYVIPFGQWRQAIPLLRELCAEPRRIRAMGERGRAFIAAHYGRETAREALLAAYRNGAQADRRRERPPTPAQRNGDVVVAALRGSVRDTAARSKLRLAYFCWHFPVPSETFVLNELRLLVADGIDVTVFCRHSPHPDFAPDFDIRWQPVCDVEDLARQLRETGRSWVHAHFAYPTVTNMVWPACEQAGIPFSFIAHAQDIFRYENDRKNRVGEIAGSALCRAVFTLGRFHRDYLIERGVPADKIVINPNAVDLSQFPYRAPVTGAAAARRVCAIHRLTEKKGLHDLVLAAKRLAAENIQIDIYGYGEDEARLLGLIEAQQAGNVRLLGPLKTRGEVLETLRRYALFAAPCVRTASGDMDGLPTSIVEAMAAGTPVITTSISSIPDLVKDGVTGILVEPGDPDALAQGIRRFFTLDAGQVDAMSRHARRTVEQRHDAQRLTRVLQRIWTGETVDLVIVSWNNLEELKEVVARIYAHTRVPFHLTICDNASAPEVVAWLCLMQETHDNLSVVYRRENSYVGPGTNAAMEQGRSKYVIYLCSKEGFVLTEGWETALIDWMDAHPAVGLGGSLGYSPSYLFGKDLPAGVREFTKFRNPQFAAQHPERRFFHVQGGLFILRREMLEAIGGFSDAVPHAYTDVEYSYYVESCGWQLGDIPGMLALYNKTRPDFWSRMHEGIRAIHSPRLEDLPLLDRIVRRQTRLCNVCGWHGPQFDQIDGQPVCPSCRSRPGHRALYRYLAESDLTFRTLPALIVDPHACLNAFWRKAFDGTRIDDAGLADLAPGGFELTVAFEPDAAGGDRLAEYLELLMRATAATGLIVLVPRDSSTIERALDELRATGFRLQDRVLYPSEVVQYSPHPLLLLRMARMGSGLVSCV